MNEIQKITIIDKIKLKIMKLMGYCEGKMYTNETRPYMRKYSFIQEMNIAQIEERLKKAIANNKKMGKLVSGITEKECYDLIEWVIQRDREVFLLDYKHVEDFRNDSLMGCCGFSQEVIARLLMKLGLEPRISNVNPTISGKSLGGHAFTSVAIPTINSDGKIKEDNYLLDATFKQFFVRDYFSTAGRFVKDKKFGYKASPFAGYFLMKLPGGEKFANELLKDGFCKLTPQNAKLYGDAFILQISKNKEYAEKYEEGVTVPVPRKSELKTGISGKQYIEWMTDPERQDNRDLEYSFEELEEVIGDLILTPSEEINKKNKNTESQINNIDSKVKNEEINNDFEK